MSLILYTTAMTGPQTPVNIKHYEDPEIIPPGSEPPKESRGPIILGGSADERSYRRVYLTRISPLGLLPFMLLGCLAAIALFVFLFSFFLFLIPMAGFVLAAAVLAGVLRGALHRLR
ncbi:MAG TPA: hypothetical protein VFG05_08800 [Methylocella sp.]|nr:hypothetical protein [Methylocella sp.]